MVLQDMTSEYEQFNTAYCVSSQEWGEKLFSPKVPWKEVVLHIVDYGWSKTVDGGK